MHARRRPRARSSSRDCLHGTSRQRAVGAGVQVGEVPKNGKLGTQPMQIHKPREYPHVQRLQSVPDAASSGPAAERPLWQPSPEDRERAEMTRFMRWAGERRGGEFEGYEDLWRWSVRGARGLLAEHLGVLRRARLRTAMSGRSPSAACPARSGSPARSSTTQRTCCAARRTRTGARAAAMWTPSRCCTARSCASSGELTLG